MFQSIVVGTDGSQTAGEAVRGAIELAKELGATIELVSAYEPVSNQRLREEARQVPADLQWIVNPREDVDATLRQAATGVRLSCQILCDHDISVRAISRLTGSGRPDPGNKPEPHITPPPEWIPR